MIYKKIFTTYSHSSLHFQWLVVIVNVPFDILIPKVKSRIVRGTIVDSVDMVSGSFLKYAHFF